MLMKQGTRRKASLSVLVAAMMILLLMVTPMVARAEEGVEASQPPRQTVIISNTVRLSDLVATEGDGESSTEGEDASLEDEQEEEPAGNTRVAIEWLEDATYAPDSLTAVIGSSGEPVTVDLTRANGWVAHMDIDQTMMTYYTLLGAKDYIVNTEEGQIVFAVADVFENPDAEEEEEIVEPVEEEETEEPEATEVEEEDEMADISGVELDVDFYVTRDGVPISLDDQVFFGDVIVLKGTVFNPDDLAYKLQWQYNNGSGWRTLDGANAEEHSYTLTEENLYWKFRLLFIVIEDEPAA